MYVTLENDILKCDIWLSSFISNNVMLHPHERKQQEECFDCAG